MAPAMPGRQDRRVQRIAGVSLFEIARFMGTSVDQIDKTYGHLLPDSLDRTRSALDVFIADTARVAKEV